MQPPRPHSKLRRYAPSTLIHHPGGHLGHRILVHCASFRKLYNSRWDTEIMQWELSSNTPCCINNCALLENITDHRSPVMSFKHRTVVVCLEFLRALYLITIPYRAFCRPHDVITLPVLVVIIMRKQKQILSDTVGIHYLCHQCFSFSFSNDRHESYSYQGWEGSHRKPVHR
jgi:hypothetical protein